MVLWSTYATTVEFAGRLPNSAPISSEERGVGTGGIGSVASVDIAVAVGNSDGVGVGTGVGVESGVGAGIEVGSGVHVGVGVEICVAGASGDTQAKAAIARNAMIEQAVIFFVK